MTKSFTSDRERHHYYNSLRTRPETKMEGAADLVFRDSIGKIG